LKKTTARIIVLRPGSVAGPVQGLGFEFWPGQPSQFFFKKIQNDVVLVKNKSQRVCKRVFLGQPAGSSGSHWGFSSLVFSSTRPGSSPGSTWQAGSSFKIIAPINFSLKTNLLTFKSIFFFMNEQTFFSFFLILMSETWKKKV
jgi:hypothetical protein